MGRKSRGRGGGHRSRPGRGTPWPGASVGRSRAQKASRTSLVEVCQAVEIHRYVFTAMGGLDALSSDALAVATGIVTNQVLSAHLILPRTLLYLTALSHGSPRFNVQSHKRLS